MDSIKILVIDDEPQIRKLFRAGLSTYGYEVIAVTSGEEAIASVPRQRPDIIILDINLGSNPNGLDVCRELREWNTAPIIMLSVNDDKRTKLAALNAGADDYITKPFDMEELEARIRAVLRRGAIRASNSVNGEIRVHELVINLVKRRVMLKCDEIHLTPTEYKLLCMLATHPGQVLIYDTLMEAIRGRTKSPKTEHSLHVYINTLRKKLRDDSANRIQPHYIYNEPSIGYRFADVQPSGTPFPEPIFVVST